MRLGNRIRVALVVGLCSVIAAAATGWVVIDGLAAERRTSAEKLLIRAMKTDRERVERYFDQVDRVLRLLADSRYTREAIMEFAVAFDELGDGAPRILRRLYVDENPYLPHRRQSLVAAADDDSWYSELHGNYHPWFRATLEVIDVRDLFLVSEAGDVVYSVAKGDLYGERLTQGANGATKLADVFRQILWSRKPEAIIVADFTGSRQGPGAETAYLGTPVFARGERIGSLVLQLDAAVLQRLMARGARIGTDVSSYLVGDDLGIRAASQAASDRPIDTGVVRDAVDGLTGVRRTRADDTDTLTAFGPLQWHDRRWAVVTRIDRATIVEPVRDRAWVAALLTLLLGLVFGAGGYALAEPES